MKGLRAPALSRLLDVQASRLFRMTANEAHKLGCCVRCRLDVNLREMGVLDQNEWHLSGLCPSCYEALMPVDDDCE